MKFSGFIEELGVWVLHSQRKEAPFNVIKKSEVTPGVICVTMVTGFFGDTVVEIMVTKGEAFRIDGVTVSEAEAIRKIEEFKPLVCVETTTLYRNHMRVDYSPENMADRRQSAGNVWMPSTHIRHSY